MVSSFVTLLVILELVFAFSIGLICILFSISLLRALRCPDIDVSNGVLPPSRSSEKIESILENYKSNHHQQQHQKQQQQQKMNDIIENGYDIIHDYDIDVEEVDVDIDNRNFVGAIHSFLSYLK